MATLNDERRINNLGFDNKNKNKYQFFTTVPVEPSASTCLSNYCKKCVNEYLSNEDKPCICCTKKSKESIEYTEGLNKHHIPDVQLKYKCPYDNCNEYFELKDLLDHIQKCYHNNVRDIGKIYESREILMNDSNEKFSKFSAEVSVENLEKKKTSLKDENLELKSSIESYIKENNEMAEKLQNENVELKIILCNFMKENKVVTDKLQAENVELKTKLEKYMKGNDCLIKKFEQFDVELKKEKKEACKKQNQYKYTFYKMSQLKKNEYHYSPAFQLSNYIFRFRVSYNCEEISTRIVLLSSSNYSTDEWPIKKRFIFEILSNNDIPLRGIQFDYKSSKCKCEYEKLKSDYIEMHDSNIQTKDMKFLFDNDNFTLRLTLH